MAAATVSRPRISAQGVVATMFLSSWKPLAIGLAALGLSVGTLAAREEPPEPKPDRPPPSAARGLREIEARLIHAEFDLALVRRLVQRNQATDRDVEDVLDRARVGLARLLDMRDEIGARRDEIAFDHAIAELDRAAARDSSGPRLDRAREAKLTDLKAERIQHEIDRLDEGARRIDRLVAWTREHFPDAGLTILDDAPREEKEAE